MNISQDKGRYECGREQDARCEIHRRGERLAVVMSQGRPGDGKLMARVAVHLGSAPGRERVVMWLWSRRCLRSSPAHLRQGIANNFAELQTGWFTSGSQADRARTAPQRSEAASQCASRNRGLPIPGSPVRLGCSIGPPQSVLSVPRPAAVTVRIKPVTTSYTCPETAIRERIADAERRSSTSCFTVVAGSSTACSRRRPFQ
jgi:hypothetical protein